MGTRGAPVPQPDAGKASTCSPERPHAEEPNRHPSCTHQAHLGCSDPQVSLGSPTCRAPHFRPRAAQRSSCSVLPGLGSGQPTPTWWRLWLHRSLRGRRYKNPDRSYSEQIL